ncbi:50S ribosomal protein L13 [Patescibacteria group bacterium]|nr:50S ribosomal protein L13 [Patescibacteria group bacterium]
MNIRMHKDLKNRVAHNVAPMEYTVDAKGRTLGRVASEAAHALLGKKSTSFVKNKVLPVQVTIVNAKKLMIREKMLKEKTYRRYTGYPGGLREMTLAEFIEKKGIAEVLKKTVDGMLPRNRLRKERMKRLTVND